MVMSIVAKLGDFDRLIKTIDKIIANILITASNSDGRGREPSQKTVKAMAEVMMCFVGIAAERPNLIRSEKNLRYVVVKPSLLTMVMPTIARRL